MEESLTFEFLKSLQMSPIIVEEIEINAMFTGFVFPVKPKPANKKKLGKYQRIKKDDPLLTQDCGICMQVYQIGEYKRALPDCKHTFHKKCCDHWFKSNNSCPICRKNYN